MVSASPSSTSVTSKPVTARERGASEIFMLVLMTALLAFAGLAYDAGMAFNARRDATNLAASAARAGANQVSVDALYEDGVARLDDSAAGTAEQAIRDQVDEVRAYELSDDELLVEVDIEYETVFLQIIGINSLSLQGEATARVQSGEN